MAKKAKKGNKAKKVNGNGSKEMTPKQVKAENRASKKALRRVDKTVKKAEKFFKSMTSMRGKIDKAVKKAEKLLKVLPQHTKAAKKALPIVTKRLESVQDTL